MVVIFIAAELASFGVAMVVACSLADSSSARWFLIGWSIAWAGLCAGHFAQRLVH